jgi:hypothetical protein
MAGLQPFSQLLSQVVGVCRIALLQVWWHSQEGSGKEERYQKKISKLVHQ